MPTYTDQLAQIAEARGERDRVKNELYLSQLKHLALKKAIRKTAAGDIATKDLHPKELADLESQRKQLTPQLQKEVARLAELQQQEALLDARTQLLLQIRSEVSDYNQKLQSANEELQMDIEKERRVLLLQRIKEIQTTHSELEKRENVLTEEVEKLKRSGASRQEEKKALSQKEQESRSKLADLDRQIAERSRDRGPAGGSRNEDLDESQNNIRNQRSRLDSLNSKLSGLIDTLYAGSPQQLISEWNDGIPILLLPVRLETRFKTIDGRHQLWVRVFPDEIAVTSHEKVLTEKEFDYGKAYWSNLWSAGQDEIKKKQSWRIIADVFGANRAAWVAQQTRPLNWESVLTSLDQLQFPEPGVTKNDSWTEAPHTRVLPDKFVLLAYRGDQVVHNIPGNLVDDIVSVGPAPVEDGEKPGLNRNDTTNQIEFSEGISWLKDFPTAVKKGLGFVVSLDEQSALQGFDRLVVIGVKLSYDKDGCKQLLEDLLSDHHYSKKGLAFVKQGTPTNNTDNADAGFTSKDQLNELSYFVEAGKELFQPTVTDDEATDGQRLAEYLGIEYAPLQNLLNSDCCDHSEAVAMSYALYEATAGYYLNSMLNEVVPEEEMKILRSFFCSYVTGRGPTAAIRVGKQPYGILPTSDFKTWKYPERTNRLNGGDRFFKGLYRFLSYLEQHWQNAATTLPHIGKTGDASKNLLSVLGLNPTSVEYFQRVGYSSDTIKNLESFQWGGKYFWDAFKASWNGYTIPSLLEQFGYRRTRENGSAKPVPLLLQLIFQHYHTLLDAKNLIDGEVLSEDRKIKPYDTGRSVNYIDWLIANVDTQKIQEEDFEGAENPNSLLYMMLRHALLLETSHSIYDFLKKRNVVADELIRSRKFSNISTTPTVSHWEVFDAPVNVLVPTEGTNRSLYAHIHSISGGSPDADVVEDLTKHKWALSVLTKLPTARLERAFAEHVDTLSYRLDAWQTALIEERLRSQRLPGGQAGQRSKGVYLGAYGYLESVRPSTSKRVAISEDLLPSELKIGKGNLYHETANGGYVHAPTLNHATAAAVLRNGYLTHASPSDRELMNVNLSSERVRRAMYLIDGIRNGQPVEVLLGYQFERGLHEWSTRLVNPVILNDLIPEFRKSFPIKKTKVPQEGNVTGPEETIFDYHVTNGLDLAQSLAAAPYITPSSALGSSKIDAIRIEKENIQNTLDALRDVLVSESVYQLALGNFERAAAVMQSISDSHLPPDIEVIKTVRGTNLSFTNRVAIQFDVSQTGNPWAAILMHQKAMAEPALNNWLATLLGTPSKIRCRVRAVDKDGNTLKRTDHTPVEIIISLEQLALQPLDFILLVRKKVEESGTSELEGRIRYFFSQAESVSDSIIVKIEFSDSGTDDLSFKSFAEILPLADELRQLICGSRPIGAGSFQVVSKELVQSGDNPEAFDVTELLSRTSTVFSFFSNLFTQLQSAVSDAETIKTPVTINALRNLLKMVSDEGFDMTFPQSSFGTGPEQAASLIVQGKSALKRFDDLKSKYTEKLTSVNGTAMTPSQKISLLTEMIRYFLGQDYVVMPRFRYYNLPEITSADLNRAGLLNYSLANDVALPVEEWFQGVSLVRSRMHNLGMVDLLAQSLDGVGISLSPVQLPHKTSDSWLAVQFPPSTTIEHDTISMVQHLPQGFNAATDQCGLLVDEWTEAIPNREEVTGISFNYNQPNSTPPQALLLAVTPEETGHWNWDHLVNSVLDTFKRAKQRAVEPDQLDAQGVITGLFPALVSEFSTSRNNISLDYRLNIASVYKEIAALNINSISPWRNS
jgi:hypothetical protein